MPRGYASELLKAGLGTALGESGLLPCQKWSNRHANMRRTHADWRFCHFCGISLEVKQICSVCGKKFISAAAYKAHFNVHGFHYCPKGSSHVMRFFKNRNVYFCNHCQKEYGPEEVKTP